MSETKAERRVCAVCFRPIVDTRWVLDTDAHRIHADCAANQNAVRIETQMGIYYAVRKGKHEGQFSTWEREMDNKRQTWTCRIGVSGAVEVPSGGDSHMRDAVRDAFKTLTGSDAEHCFSGWGDEWDESELAVIENRPPRHASAEWQIKELADFIMAEVPGEPSQSEGAVDTAIRWMRERLAEQVSP